MLTGFHGKGVKEKREALVADRTCTLLVQLVYILDEQKNKNAPLRKRFQYNTLYFRNT